MWSRAAIALAFAGHLCAQSILPPPPVPAGNPMTPAKVLLGKALFWDEQLSSSRAVACGTCHVFSHGGADPRSFEAVHPGADGMFGTGDDVHGSFGVVRTRADGNAEAAVGFGLQVQVTGRRAPSVINAAYAAALFVDGRADGVFADPISGSVVLSSDAALERQLLDPPVSDVEMGHVGRSWADIAMDLPGLVPLALASNVPVGLQQFIGGQSYAALFQQVFGSPGVTPVRIAFAIAAYERTLISDQSPFDLYLAGQGTLPVLAQAGLLRFEQSCAVCHVDVESEVLVMGPRLDDYRNIGVRPPVEDGGRAVVTGRVADRGRFRVPGLRNVELRPPYFHNGSVGDLGGVVDFYARGGDDHDNQDPLIAAIANHITIADRLALVSLLQSMTDPRVRNELPPFDRPRLCSEGAGAPRRFGNGTAGALPPRISVSGPAVLGLGRFGVGVDRAAANAPALLLLDAAAGTQSWLGHEIYVAGTAALFGLPQATGNGHAWQLLPVPAAPGLAGLPLFGQWLVLDATAPAGIASSDAFGAVLLR